MGFEDNAIFVRAQRATKKKPFQINLTKVRDAVEEIMNEWRSSGFFREFTRHDIIHPDSMLDTAEWIIPADTKVILTDADCLLITLSIYLHDIGLLITKKEFENRSKNQHFQEFLKEKRLEARNQENFNASLGQMSEDERNQLLYEEYVRIYHGRRVRQWILGDVAPELRQSLDVDKILNPILSGLRKEFKRDLAIVCESHTLDDLDDHKKYPVSQPYGGKDDTANVQYCAAVLRTVDLLQITESRAPSIAFQLISPNNPNSQIEWQKQNGVVAVRPQLKRNVDGEVDKSIQSDTIEIHANFSEPKAFFGLTSYLKYAEEQLESTFKLIEGSRRDTAEPYSFPWRFFDQDYIETEGFLHQSFEFKLHQSKILDLLTGHTLYNNSDVVLRELTQNALDAVRLKAHEQTKNARDVGLIQIEFREETKELVVRDNGTGMTQEIIESHFLKVGSSRYQDEKFRDRFPAFHSISRFGIGVLSAFMVSDDVQITTCSEEDEVARQISLQSVHGKYLIKTFDKELERSAIPVWPHGTEVRLKIRPSANVADILALAKRWLVFPESQVLVSINDDDPVLIGYSSPKEAIESLVKEERPFLDGGREFKVIEKNENGLSVAILMERAETFKDWSPSTRFIDRRRRAGAADAFLPVATCIEGVAVEEFTPGYRSVPFVAIANALGKGSPKTNVARSSLEETQELRVVLERIYGFYVDVIVDEMERLRKEDGFSLSRAVEIGRWNSSVFSREIGPAIDQSLLFETLDSVPSMIIESDETRSAVSVNDVVNSKKFFTVESSLRRSLESLVKEAPANVSASKLMSFLGNEADVDADAQVICNYGYFNYSDRRIEQQFEISDAHLVSESRRLALGWSISAEEERWISSRSIEESLIELDRNLLTRLNEGREKFRGNDAPRQVHLPLSGKVINSGFEGFGGFLSRGQIFLAPDCPLAFYVTEFWDSGHPEMVGKAGAVLLLVEALRAYGIRFEDFTAETYEDLSSAVIPKEFIALISDKRELVDAIRRTPSQIFDPFAWDRRGGDFRYV